MARGVTRRSCHVACGPRHYLFPTESFSLRAHAGAMRRERVLGAAQPRRAGTAAQDGMARYVCVESALASLPPQQKRPLPSSDPQKVIVTWRRVGIYAFAAAAALIRLANRDLRRATVFLCSVPLAAT